MPSRLHPANISADPSARGLNVGGVGHSPGSSALGGAPRRNKLRNAACVTSVVQLRRCTVLTQFSAGRPAHAGLSSGRARDSAVSILYNSLKDFHYSSQVPQMFHFPCPSSLHPPFPAASTHHFPFRAKLTSEQRIQKFYDLEVKDRGEGQFSA